MPDFSLSTFRRDLDYYGLAPALGAGMPIGVRSGALAPWQRTIDYQPTFGAWVADEVMRQNQKENTTNTATPTPMPPQRTNYLGQPIPDGGSLAQQNQGYHPPQGAWGQTQSPPPQMHPADLQALIHAMTQGQLAQGAQRLQGQQQFIDSQQPQHLGIGGGAIDPHTGHEAGNAFDNGFFKTPQQRQQTIDTRSQGMPGVASLQTNPSYLSQGQGAEGAMAASPQSYQPSSFAFQMPQPMTSPFGSPVTDASNLQQNMQMYKPGGMSRRPQPRMQASGSPRSGASFGAGAF